MKETNVQKSAKKRETNMELLRIVAMLMVLIQHCVGRGLLLGNPSINISNLILIRFLDSLAQVANASFLFITGYYMINKKFNLKRILNLWGKTILYSLIIFVICSFLGIYADALAFLFPITFGEYWFISAYIALYFLLPIINILLNKLTQRQFKYFLIALIVMLGVIRVISNPGGIFSGNIFPVIMFYSIGAYIKRFVKVKPNGRYFIKYILLTFIFVLTYVIVEIIQKSTTNSYIYLRLCYILDGLRKDECIILVAMAICFFMKFRTINIKSTLANRLISFIAPSMFSIYIIHESLALRDYIWQNAGLMNYANSWMMIPYILLVVLIVFIVCLLIDLLRRVIYTLLKKIPIINKGVQKINEKIDKLNTKINSIFESE